MRGDRHRRPRVRVVIEARGRVRSRTLADHLEPAEAVGLRTGRGAMGMHRGGACASRLGPFILVFVSQPARCPSDDGYSPWRGSPMCSSAWSRAGPRPTSLSGCCPGLGKPSGSRLPSMPDRRDSQTTLAFSRMACHGPAAPALPARARSRARPIVVAPLQTWRRARRPRSSRAGGTRCCRAARRAARRQVAANLGPVGPRARRTTAPPSGRSRSRTRRPGRRTLVAGQPG